MKNLIAKNTLDYQVYLIESLRDPEEAAAYMKVALEEYEEDGDNEVFLLALRNVAEAQGGVSMLAKKNQLNRQNLYRALSGKEITKGSYQATAQQFAQNVADLAPMESIEKFISLLPLKAKIIDLGCGSGRDAKIFTSRDIDVLGIDYCSNLIDIAKVHAPLAHFQLMDIQAMSFPDSSFDGAWAACSLGHIAKSQLPNVLKKIHLLLKENGYFYLTFKKGSGEILEEDLRYDGNFKKFWSFFEEDELKNMLQSVQFKILDFAMVEKFDDYQTHHAFRIFCQKD